MKRCSKGKIIYKKKWRIKFNFSKFWAQFLYLKSIYDQRETNGFGIIFSNQLVILRGKRIFFQKPYFSKFLFCQFLQPIYGKTKMNIMLLRHKRNKLLQKYQKFEVKKRAQHCPMGIKQNLFVAIIKCKIFAFVRGIMTELSFFVFFFGNLMIFEVYLITSTCPSFHMTIAYSTSPHSCYCNRMKVP